MNFQDNSLVLYKSGPARVARAGVKIDIELPDGKRLSVREKDITLLHPGPVAKLSDLDDPGFGEIEEAAAILGGEGASLPELAELIYDRYSPGSAWAVMTLLLDGLHFTGTPDAIAAVPKETREKEMRRRAEKSADKELRQGFVARIRDGKIEKDDADRIVPLEDFCLGKVQSCRLLKELGIAHTHEAAHALLLKLGVWGAERNPYPSRLGFHPSSAYPDLAKLPQEERLDLTHLESYAVDDEGNKDPDDALSIDQDTLWIHVADVAAVVTPGSSPDVQARGAGANLYLPEKTIPMLPPAATGIFGLGLGATSPALSFGITLEENGSIKSFAIHPSTVRVKRITYAAAQGRIAESPFREIYAMTERYNAFRKSQNAVFLKFPEVNIAVVNGVVGITPLREFASREMVTDAMLMAGEAAARFAAAHDLPFPYTSQPAPETVEQPPDLAAMFAYRRKLKPSMVKSSPDAHAGLGLSSYSRVTSPLRRYLDLIAHQQLRACIAGGETLNEQELTHRIGASTAMTGALQKIERLSRQHWTLVYLMQNPSWRGRGIVAEIRERYSIVIIPDLAFEARIATTHILSPNQELVLRVTGVDLPGLSAHFSIEPG